MGKKNGMTKIKKKKILINRVENTKSNTDYKQQQKE